MTKKKQLKRMLLSGILVGAFAYSGLTAYGAVIGITADIVDTADGFVIKPGGDGTSATPYVYFHNSDSTFTITDDISIAAIAAGGYITNGNFAELSAPTAQTNPFWKFKVNAISGTQTSSTAQVDTGSIAVGFQVVNGQFTANGGLNMDVTSTAGTGTATGVFKSYADTQARGLDVRNTGSIIIDGNANIKIVAKSGTATSDEHAGTMALVQGIISDGTVDITGNVTMNLDTTAGIAISDALDADSFSDVSGIFVHSSGSTDIAGTLNIQGKLKGGTATSANGDSSSNIVFDGLAVNNSGSTITIGDTVTFNSTATGGESTSTNGTADSQVEVTAVRATDGTITLNGGLNVTSTAIGGKSTAFGVSDSTVDNTALGAEGTGNIIVNGDLTANLSGTGGEAASTGGGPTDADAFIAVGGIANQGTGTITVTGNTTINAVANGGTMDNSGDIENDMAIAWGVSANDGTIDLQGDVIITTTATSNKDTSLTDGVTKTYALNAIDGTININQGAGGKKVQLTGDVLLDNAGTGAINVKLDTSDSFLKGTVDNYSSGAQSNLTFSNGATWMPTGNGIPLGSWGMVISDFGDVGTGLTIENGGVLDMAAWHLNPAGVNTTNAYREIAISGKATLNDGAVYRINSDVANGVSDRILFVTTPTATGTHHVQIGYDPSVAAQLDAGTTTLTPTTPIIVVNNIGTGLTGAEGKESQIDGALFRHTLNPTVSYDGSGVGTISLDSIATVTEKKSLSEAPRTAIDAQQAGQNAWMNQGNHMIRRLGDLRLENDDAKNGIWARVYTGSNRVKSGSYGRKFDQDYTGTQLGYDRKLETSNGHFYLGGLFDYQTSDASFLRGEGDVKSYGLGLYGSWVSDKGHHVDLVLRGSKIDNDYSATDINNNKIDGSYDLNAYGVSIEYGYRKDLKKNFFVEPQAQLNFGHMGSGDHTLSNGVKISQDSIMTGTGRLGILLGKEFGKDVKKGNVYFQTSLIQDFSETPSMYASNNGQRVKIDSIDTKGTSFEFALGTNYKFNENGKLYIEISKTVNGKIDTRWQLNGGVRIKF